MDFNNNPDSHQQDELMQEFLPVQEAADAVDAAMDPIVDTWEATDTFDEGVASAVSATDMELERIIEDTKLEAWGVPAESSPEPSAFSAPADFDLPATSALDYDAPVSAPIYEPPAQPYSQPEVSNTFIANPENTPMQEQPFLQQTQFFAPAEFDYTQELPHTEFASMTEAAAPVLKEEPKAEEPALEQTEKAPTKRRPERKKGYGLLGLPHLASTLVWLGIIVAIGVTLGRLIWVAASDMLAFNKPYVSAVITITEEDSLDSIVEDLEDAGLVRYPVLFKAFVNIKGGRSEFATGTFTFTNDRLYDYNAIMNNMNPTSSGREVVADLVIPEGYTCAQIFALLEEKGVCTVAELEEYCANGEIKDYWFLEGVTRGDKYCLEGYLFPNTYDFYKDDSPAHVIGKMLSSFDDNYTDVLKDKLEPLNQRLATTLANRGFSQEYIDSHKLTIREIVIIASMIERESTGGEERFKVSGVIFNRLTNPKQFPKLQIDATIIYALGGNLDENGNVKPLTKADLAMDHPYNTYVYDGLTPGPISNPGSASINAALDPNDEGYYFYVFDPEAGEHIFSKTVEEHEKAVNKVRG